MFHQQLGFRMLNAPQRDRHRIGVVEMRRALAGVDERERIEVAAATPPSKASSMPMAASHPP